MYYKERTEYCVPGILPPNFLEIVNFSLQEILLADFGVVGGGGEESCEHIRVGNNYYISLTNYIISPLRGSCTFRNPASFTKSFIDVDYVHFKRLCSLLFV
jgi:hypothetical protein